MLFALINVIGICPLVASTMPASSSCCPHSKGPQIPCTESSSHNCPYVLLEKAKSERGLAATSLVAIPATVGAQVHPISRFLAPIVSQYLQDSSGSYLIHRVLRI